VVDVVQVMATLAAMVVVIGGIAAAVVAIRRWIGGLAEAAARAAEQTTHQLRTSNGKTIAEYTEQTAAAVADLRSEIGVLTGLASNNHELASEAIRIAERAEAKVDAHLIGHQA
jgi:hypothetical protein